MWPRECEGLAHRHASTAQHGTLVSRPSPSVTVWVGRPASRRTARGTPQRGAYREVHGEAYGSCLRNTTVSHIIWPVFSSKWQWSRKKVDTYVPGQDFFAITTQNRLTARLCATGRLTARLCEKMSSGVVPHRKERRESTARICLTDAARIWEKSH